MEKPVELPEGTKDRLNMLMRPAADGISNYAINASILAAVTDAGGEAERIAALAYVFTTKPFARWSGPPTPASEYPPPPDFEGRDRAAFEALKEDLRFVKQLQAFSMQVIADETDVPERARRAWMFLNEHATTPMAKVTALILMLVDDDSPFLEREIPPTGLRYTDQIPNEECREIRWRNRATLARLRGIRSCSEIKQKAALGAAVLAALSGISDERERAFILGDFLNEDQRDTVAKLLAMGQATIPDAILGALRTLAEHVNAAEEQGNPCPACGKVHTSGEAHEGK